MKKAIFFTVFDRLVYLKKTLDSWAKVEGIENYDVYFKVEPSEFLDGELDVINDFYDKINTNLYIIINDELMGCAENVWSGFNALFEKYDFVILAEDDILVSKDILNYFDYLENKYNEDDKVSIISANTKDEGIDSSLVVRQQKFNGLVWGTWKKYWVNYFKNTWDKDYSSGVPGGWDWNLTLRVLPNNDLYVIHPCVSRSQHIGITGIHSTAEIFDLSQSPSFKEDNEWSDLREL